MGVKSLGVPIGERESRKEHLMGMVAKQLINGVALKALSASHLMTMVRCCINPSFVYIGYSTSRDAL